MSISPESIEYNSYNSNYSKSLENLTLSRSTMARRHRQLVARTKDIFESHDDYRRIHAELDLNLFKRAEEASSSFSYKQEDSEYQKLYDQCLEALCLLKTNYHTERILCESIIKELIKTYNSWSSIISLWRSFHEISLQTTQNESDRIRSWTQSITINQIQEAAEAANCYPTTDAQVERLVTKLAHKISKVANLPTITLDVVFSIPFKPLEWLFHNDQGFIARDPTGRVHLWDLQGQATNWPDQTLVEWLESIPLWYNISLMRRTLCVPLIDQNKIIIHSF